MNKTKINPGGHNNKLALDQIDRKRVKNKKIEIVYRPGRTDPFYKTRYFEAVENDRRHGLEYSLRIRLLRSLWTNVRIFCIERRIPTSEKNSAETSLPPFDFKIATYKIDESNYYHEVCCVGKVSRERGLKPGMQIIKINDIICTQKNQKDLIFEIQTLNFFQIETKISKVQFQKFHNLHYTIWCLIR